MTTAPVFSSYVIADPCIGVKDGTCVEVCPVDCIETTPDETQFFIDPELCIACEQCVLVCPVDAIYLVHEVPEQWKGSIETNAAFFLRAKEEAPSVSLEQAEAMIEAARSRATEIGIKVAVAVLDRNCAVVAEDSDTSVEHDDVARNKAYTAVTFELATTAITDRLVESPPAGIEPDASRVVRDAGGLPFGRPYVLGAIGVAGGTPEQDLECGRVAVTTLWPD
ncbi:MAG: heme-binding protein [Chloroflexi bacterium]|nr:heme-binding protein [Chloroflexota bacterium]